MLPVPATSIELWTLRERSCRGDVVVHLAGLAHGAVSTAAWESVLLTNVQETALTYAKAADADVRLFIQLSSIRVLGDSTTCPWPTDAPLAPSDAYAESKAQSETELSMLAQGLGTPADDCASANRLWTRRQSKFLRLLWYAQKGWPLPLLCATAQRSWLALDNLVDFLMHICALDVLDSSIWHVRDVEETSLAEMLGLLHELMGQPNRLWPVNARLALGLGRTLGSASTVDRCFYRNASMCAAPMAVSTGNRHSVSAMRVKETVNWFRRSSSRAGFVAWLKRAMVGGAHCQPPAIARATKRAKLPQRSDPDNGGIMIAVVMIGYLLQTDDESAQLFAVALAIVAGVGCGMT